VHNPPAMQQVGRIQSIWRYPVKSMRGQSLASCEIYWYGIEGDRRYAFVRGDTRSSFPWLTGRQVPQMLTYDPRLLDLTNPLESPVMVRTPDGIELSIDSDELRRSMEKDYGGPVHLMQLRRGAYDAMAISIISTSTIAAIGASNDARRFRPNFVIELQDPRAFGEDEWIGAALQLGERDDAVRLRVLRPTKRCKMICIDPDSISIDPSYLQATADQHEACAGVYAVPETVGSVHDGDAIFLI
jgi:uncharacterized protein YcbX